MLFSSGLVSPKSDILKSDIRTAIVDRQRVGFRRRSGGERSCEAFAATGEEVSIANVFERIIVVDMN